MLLARIYEVLPLTCPFCLAEMRIIAFITEPSAVRQILDHLGEATRPPRIAPRADHRYGKPQRPPRRAMTRPGTTPPAGTGGRIRSAHHLVSSNSALALGTLGRPLQRTKDFGFGRGPVRLLRAGARQNAEVGGSCGRDGENHGKMRRFLRTGRRKLILTTTKRSRILGPGPLNCLSLARRHPHSLGKWQVGDEPWH
jgi:hypothetical protein